MRRSYRSERFLAILSRVRDQIPDAAITTDIIVGFPTETDADLAETLRVIEASHFSGAFTFQYSRAFSLTSWDVVERSERRLTNG